VYSAGGLRRGSWGWEPGNRAAPGLWGYCREVQDRIAPGVPVECRDLEVVLLPGDHIERDLRRRAGRVVVAPEELAVLIDVQDRVVGAADGVGGRCPRRRRGRGVPDDVTIDVRPAPGSVIGLRREARVDAGDGAVEAERDRAAFRGPRIGRKGARSECPNQQQRRDDEELRVADVASLLSPDPCRLGILIDEQISRRERAAPGRCCDGPGAGHPARSASGAARAPEMRRRGAGPGAVSLARYLNVSAFTAALIFSTMSWARSRPSLV
jgi:hypothetical protein